MASLGLIAAFVFVLIYFIRRQQKREAELLRTRAALLAAKRREKLHARLTEIDKEGEKELDAAKTASAANRRRMLRDRMRRKS